MAYTGEQKKAYQLAWIKKRRDTWIESKGGRCAIFGCNSTNRLEVGHIDPSLKTMQPTAIWSRAEAVREKELANCQVLCYDCHLLKTNLEKEVPHGTHGRYISQKCRCVECKKAHSELARTTRAAGKKW